jgi:integrase
MNLTNRRISACRRPLNRTSAPCHTTKPQVADPDPLRYRGRSAVTGDRHIALLTLRHTAASLMFDAGMTIFEVQHRLSHKSPTLTAEVYTHLMRERSTKGAPDSRPT